MRVSFFLPAFALLSTGMAGSAMAQHEHSSGAEALHAHLSRIFSSEGAETADVAPAPEACCKADEPSEVAPEAAPVAAKVQDGERGFMGIQMNVTDGAMVVVGVIDGSPAAQAGLEAGDRIVRIGSHEVAGQEELTGFLAGIRPGQTESLTVDRNGWTKSIELTFASRPDFDQRAPAVVELREQFGSGHQGLEGDAKTELKRKIRKKLGQSDAGGHSAFFFKHDTDDQHDVEHDADVHFGGDVRVEIKHENDDEPSVQIRINGEDVDLGDLEGLDLGEIHLEGLSGLSALSSIKGLECLEDLDCLKSLECLEGLEGLKCLEGLEGMKCMITLDGLDGLVELKGLDGLVELKAGAGLRHFGGGHGFQGKPHPRFRVDMRGDHHDEGGHGFSWFSKHDDDGDDASDVREELRELRNEMRELRRERLGEIERLRHEVRSLLRSLDR